MSGQPLKAGGPLLNPRCLGGCGALQTVGMTVFFLEALSPLCLCDREGRRPFGADGSAMTRSGVVDVRFAVPPRLDYGFFVFSFGWVLWVCSCSFVSIKVW